MRSLFLIFMPAVFIMSGLIFPVEMAKAHGDEKHDDGKKMSLHMQAMYELKEEIPKDYRIMERTPIIPDDKSIERGKDLFDTHCALCHGRTGQGDGPAAKGLNPPPANFLDVEHSSIYGPGEKFWIIGHGSGETGMPGFKQISLKDRWNLVNYIFKLQGNLK